MISSTEIQYTNTQKDKSIFFVQLYTGYFVFCLWKDEIQFSLKGIAEIKITWCTLLHDVKTPVTHWLNDKFCVYTR